MKNVSFDNPYLLLLIIPLAVILTVPTVIAMVKGIKTKTVAVSFVIHLIIAVAATLAIAGMKSETVITRTEIYVVADVSYSSNRNLDRIDELIGDVATSAPDNSEIGVIAFAKDAELLSALGTPTVSVKGYTVDDSATDIATAINFAAGRFSADAIKRIVLITDGKETVADAAGRLVGAIENLNTSGIYIDAVYVDANLAEDAKEVQVDDVQFKSSTYKGHETTADVAVRSTYDTKAIIRIYRDGEVLDSQSVSLVRGYNIVNIPLDTSESGVFDYKLEISSDEIEDGSSHNNFKSFTQTVAEELNVLLVSGSADDAEAVALLYGDSARITLCGSANGEPLPVDIEELCRYDEIILSSIDLSTLDNYDAFISCVDIAVSSFGKTLMTMGDLNLQNTNDEVLKKLSNILPVRFGNNDGEPKLYSIIIDVSRSMQDAYQLIMAKQAAIHLLNMLGDEDYVSVVAFSGDARVVQAPTKAANREAIARIVNELEPSQGTLLGAALDETYKMIALLPYEEKQVMLISDGRTYSQEPENAVSVARQMRAAGIVTSAINVASAEGVTLLKNIASTGGGKYYYVQNEEELELIMFGKIQDSLTETVIEGESEVVIERPNDECVKDFIYIPDVNGYVYSSAKSSAVTVLTTRYAKNADETTSPPIYSYWDYGNGRVATLTTSASGKWTALWRDSEGDEFLRGLANINTPDEKVDYPYTITVSYDGIHSTVEMVPTILNPYASVEIAITAPSGEVTRATSDSGFTFDSSKYVYSFLTTELGKYEIKIIYAYGDKSFESVSYFNLSYSPEYDCFEIFSPSPLHAAIRNRGSVNENEVPKLENDEKEVETYIITYAIPLLIIAVCLYVIDIMIRKLKWNDIKGLFKWTKRIGGAK